MKVDSYPRESLNQGPCVFERVHGRYATLSVRQSGTHDGLANANPHDFARDDERRPTKTIVLRTAFEAW